MKKRIKNNKFILLLGIVLIVLFSFYTLIGSHYYLNVLPYYDSLSYQVDFQVIMNSYNQHGYLSNFFSLLHPTTYFLPKILTLLGAPLLPSLPYGLYVVFYICAFYALINIALIMIKSGISKSTIVCSFLFLFSLNLFSILSGGILDQRLDFVASLLFLNVLFSGWYFISRTNIASSIVLTISGFILVTYRPILFVPLILVLPFLLYAEISKIEQIWRLLNWRYLIVFAITGFLLTITILPSREFLHYYYFIWNRDFGTNTGLLEMIKITWGYLFTQIGLIPLLLFSATLFAGVVRNKKYLKYFLLPVVTIIPYVLTRSTNSLVYYPVVMVLVFVFFQFVKFLGVFNRSVLIFLLFFLVLINFYQTTIAVKHSLSNEREVALKFLNKLVNNSKTRHISSFTPEGSSILALNFLYGDGSLTKGRLISHQADLQGKSLQENILEICNLKGYLMTISPQYPDDPDHYLWSYRHNQETHKLVKSISCFKKLDLSYERGGVKYLFYKIQ